MGKHFMEVHNLVKNYGTGNAAVNAVDHVSFHVEQGEFIGMMGASGSGKTTILNILSAIDTMSEGQVIYRMGSMSKTLPDDEVDLSKMDEDELADFRQKNLGFVFQDYNLLDMLSIEENIMLPMALCGKEIDEAHSVRKSRGINKVYGANKAYSKEEIENRVRGIAETLHIVDILDKFPYEVSGGQKQRAACARALVNHPKLILADEPTGALDSKSTAMLLDTLQIMNEELGATILMVTHDVFSACYCGRILFLRDGKICSELERGDMGRRDYLNRILDIQAQMGGGGIYAE